MYKLDRTLGLVTIASPLNNNLTLLDVNEYLNADSLGVIHDGYINVISMMMPERRAKYVSIETGANRGKGLIKMVKWLKFNDETLFVVLSTSGVQIHDAEVTFKKFNHSCKEPSDLFGFASAACVLHGRLLCVGNSAGNIWVFASQKENTEFVLTEKLFAHKSTITCLEGLDNLMVSAGKDGEIQVWKFHSGEMHFLKYLGVQGLMANCTAMKFINYLLVCGFDSGEICIFDLMDEEFVVREVAHILEITALDFSPLKTLILTASADRCMKIWNLKQEEKRVKCMFSFSNELGPICGAAFTNFNCTELCIATACALDIQIFLLHERKKQTDAENEDL